MRTSPDWPDAPEAVVLVQLAGRDLAGALRPSAAGRAVSAPPASPVSRPRRRAAELPATVGALAEPLEQRAPRNSLSW